MDLLSFIKRLATSFRKSQRERELEDELHGHLDSLADENIRRGMSPEEARYAARREFGGVEQAKESYRERRGLPFVETLLQDVRFGARLLTKKPGFSAVAVLTLALGIGANTAIFSVVEAILLRPLPFPRADRLVMVWEDVHLPQYQNDENTPAPGNFTDWKERNSVFSGIGAIGYRSWNLSGSGEPVRVEGEAFSAGVFSVLQTYPILGRAFTAAEDRPGAAPVAILGYGLWRSRFAGDPSAVGRAILLDGQEYSVIGVMPKGFHFPDPGDQLYVPLALTGEQAANHGSHFLRVIARLKPGVTLSQAQSDLAVIAQRMTAEHPDTNTGVGVRLIDLREQRAGNLRRPLLVLSGVAGLLLLMVCANLANLLLARASAREHELAVRAALGASRMRVVRQLVAESLLLAFVGGAVALVFALWGINALRALAPADQDLSAVAMNWVVCAFNLGVALVAGILFGLAPAWQSSRREAVNSLKEARSSVSAGSARLRRTFVVAEMALGVVVLTGAGLLLRSFLQLHEIPLGFQPESVLTMRVILRGPQYAGLTERAAFYERVLQQMRALPGVQGAAAISFLPLTLQGRTAGFSVEGQPPPAPGQLPFADFRSVSPGYFQTMRIPLLRGRDFSWRDAERAPLAAVVSDAMARAFWPNGDAIGKHFKLGNPGDDVPWITVVGVAGNVRQLHLVGDPRPAMYFSAAQDVGNGDTLRDWVVRVSGSPAEAAPAIRSAIWSIDRNLPVSRVETMEQVRSGYLGPQRFTLLLVGLFGVLALILAAVGIYGVAAFSVTQRQREIGVRVTLGAGPADVLRLVLGQAARLALVGLAVGLLLAGVLAQLMASLLYGVGAHDPLTFAAVAIFLFLVAIVASYVPAQRALHVDPVIALRYE